MIGGGLEHIAYTVIFAALDQIKLHFIFRAQDDRDLRTYHVAVSIPVKQHFFNITVIIKGLELSGYHIYKDSQARDLPRAANLMNVRKV